MALGKAALILAPIGILVATVGCAIIFAAYVDETRGNTVKA